MKVDDVHFTVGCSYFVHAQPSVNRQITTRLQKPVTRGIPRHNDSAVTLGLIQTLFRNTFQMSLMSVSTDHNYSHTGMFLKPHENIKCATVIIISSNIILVNSQSAVQVTQRK